MPFPNEHACRLQDPDRYDRLRRDNDAGKVDGKRIDIVLGIHDDDGSEPQSIRYPLDAGWDDDEAGARDHCQSEGGQFEPASNEGNLMAGRDVDKLRERMRDRVSPRNSRWYDIRNQDGDKAVLRVYDEIHWLFGVTPEDFARDLEAITAPEIEVQINSPGGDVFDGIAIYNALRSHPARVTTRVDGIAASIASVIVQAGDQRTMLSGSQMMVHEAWGLAIGPAGEHREMADLLDKQTDVIAGIYAERSDREVGEFRDLMTAETWLTAQEAVDAGLADEVVNPAEQPSEPVAARSGTRFADEVSEALDVLSRVTEGAERLDADVRDKGQELSQAKRDALDGIRQRLDALLADDSPDDEDELAAILDREFVEFVATTQGAHR